MGNPDSRRGARVSTPGPRGSRRHFLLGAAAVGAASVVAGAGAASAATPRALRVRVDDHEMFRTAAAEFGVPVALLAALSHAQTRWQDHDGRPSAAMGYGPMHLIDGAAITAALERIGKDAAVSSDVDTLGRAANLLGVSREQMRRDPATNVRGAAALLADHQATTGRARGRSSDPAAWYASVVAASGLVTPSSQLDLADTVLSTMKNGAHLELADGSRLSLRQREVGKPGAQRTAVRRRIAAGAATDSDVEAPAGLDVEWIPAPYEQYGEGPGDYGNHDLAFRPRSPSIDYIVVHDTEGYWEGVLNLVQDPTYVSWQYSLRSKDGHIAQHALAKDVCWHAGNWWVNMHSIGLEHEGFAAAGADWYSEPMYRTSAALVRYLARQHRIPLDRSHIIGHDQVPGITNANIPGMHWDPGPFWDWEHYFDLLRAPLRDGTLKRRPKVGDVVRFLPGFAGNQQPVTGCETAGESCTVQGTNFVALRVAPSATADLVNDLGLHQQGQPASTQVSDISARATAGTEYVVAEVKGQWMAVWFLGVKGWFRNPASRPVARVVDGARKVRPKKGVTAKVYGRCYPEAEAYTNPADVQTVSPLLYTVGEGQAYAVGDLSPKTDYYRAKTFSLDTPGDHINIEGTDRYIQIHIGHRIGFVRAAEVDVVRA